MLEEAKRLDCYSREGGNIIRRAPSRRPRAGRRRRYTRFSLLLLLLAAGCFYLYESQLVPRFLLVKKVKVAGVHRIAPGQVERLVWEAVGSSPNLLFLNKAHLTAQLKKQPWVKSVTLRKKLPGQLIIRIVERQPHAIFGDGDSRCLCDEEGVVVTKFVPSSTTNLPIIHLNTLGLRAPGLGKRIEDRRIEGALQAITFLRGFTEYRAKSITFSEAGGIQIKLRSGCWLSLGPPIELEAKLRVALHFLDDLPDKASVRAINVSDLDFAHYTLQPAPS